MDIEQQADLEYYGIQPAQEERRAPVQYVSPLNPYKVPGVLYDPEVKEFRFNGETYYCSFGRVTVCGN